MQSKQNPKTRGSQVERSLVGRTLELNFSSPPTSVFSALTSSLMAAHREKNCPHQIFEGVGQLGLARLVGTNFFVDFLDKFGLFAFVCT